MKPSRILVVDDDRDSRELVEEYLKIRGWSVSTASDAQGCWLEIQRNLPDVILANVSLGNANGPQLVKTIKEQRKYNRIPIIAITSSGGAGERMRCFTAGCNDVLAKPFSLGELRTHLDYLISSVM